jgi:hypothetical protein
MFISRHFAIRSSLLAVIAVLAISTSALAQQTTAETSGFTEYTSYSEMIDYLQAVQATSTDMRLTIYGESYEGRELAMAIFSRPSIRRPWEALVSGRPIVLLAANVHGGERTLRESVLLMIRELATSGTELNDLLDDMIILVAPSINPDGLMASPGPTRGNAWGIDLNRDYVKLEQQALANYVTNVVNVWHPHVVVDGHNGGSLPYNVCYQGPSNASAPPEIVALCDHEIFPAINSRMEASGYRSFYYSGGNETRWRGGGYDPRIARNYLGINNTVGILFESPGRQDREIGILSGKVAYEAVVHYTHQNQQKVMDLVSRSRWEAIELGDRAEGEVTVEMEYGPEDFSVTYDVNVGDRDNPEYRTVTSDSLMKKPIPLKKRERPYAYLLPRQAVDAIAMLERHGIAIEILQEEITVEVEAYVLESVEYLREYDHDAAVRPVIKEVVRKTREFPRGTYVIPTGQASGRLVTHMLEPETNDNIVRWNTMDALLPLSPPRRRFQRGGRPGAGALPAGQQAQPREPEPPLIPIFKIMDPMPIPTRIKP